MSIKSRRIIALLLCLVMVFSSMPVAAFGMDESVAGLVTEQNESEAVVSPDDVSADIDEQTTTEDNPTADVDDPAVEEETPAVEEETPAVEEETPAVEEETPAVEEETPAVEDETPAVEDETPAVEDETPAVEDETPAVEDETPAVEDETPAVEDETPAVEDETPAVEDETPVVEEETPAVEEEIPAVEEIPVLGGAITEQYGIMLMNEVMLLDGEGYGIVTGDTDSQGTQRVRVKNITISGVEVSKHQKTGDFAATVILPKETDKTAELTFTLDCVGTPNVANGKIFVNNTEAGTMTANEGSTTEGTWTYSMVPEWDENGEATISFRSQWNTINWVAKTYTLNLRILGDENTAPTLRSDIAKETTELIAVGESYELKLTEAALWEDAELDDMTYTVSVNGAEAVEASATWYQFGPEEAGDYTLVFKAKDSAGNESADTYTVKITAMNLTKFETGGTHVDSWNVDINRIDMGLAEVDEVILSEEDGVYAYAILDSETDKDAKLFFRVKASAASSSRFHGVNINDKGVDGAKTDAANYMWTAEYTPEWNEYGEASLKFAAQPQNDGKYIYTIKLKIANAENQAPAFADGETGTDTVEQYFDYTVDVASLFDGVDDSWLSYSVSVDGGETYVDCGESFTVTPQTTDTQTLKFKAKDIFGAESEAYVLTLNVDAYEVDENALAINKATDNGELLSLTVKDAEGNIIEGINFETTTEQITKSYDSGSFAGQTFEWDETTIRVGLPETVGVSDKVVAHWHMVQNEAGLPFLSTEAYWNRVTYNTKDGVATTLNGGVGSSTVRFYDAEVTFESHEWADRYIVEYYIDRGENNKAPQLKEGVPSLAEVTMDQYDTYKVDLSTIFEEPDGDAVTYTVKVDGETKETGKDYSRELTTDDDVTLIFKATDAQGASCTYVVSLTVNPVHRLVIETGEGAGTFTSGLNKLYIYGQPAEKYVFSKDGWNRNIAVQLAETVADDAEIEIKWEGYSDGVSMTVDNPVKLVDGKAEFTVESHGHFFDKQHRYYNFSISNTPNSLPALAEGVEAAVTEEKLVGTAYELDLSTIFTDADGDDLTYIVEVNEAEAVAADAAYSFTPDATGTYTLVFRAKDAWGVSEATYTVTLTAKNSDATYNVDVNIPDAITPSFYICRGFADNGQDMTGDALTATKGTSAGGWTTYTVAVPENVSRINFRGVEGETEWGGMSIDVEAYMDAVTLRQVQAVINTKIEGTAPTAEQALFQVKYGDGMYAVSGSTGNDEYGYLYYRFLLVAADNSLVYTYYAVPQGELTNTYAINEGLTKTVTTDSADTLITTLPLAFNSPFTITAPSDATVVMYRQAGYFNYNAIAALETKDNGDGTKNVTFNTGQSSIFRVSKAGEITKAGYVPRGSTGITINWDNDDRGPGYREDYDTSTVYGSRGDDSMYVNVNYRNNLQLDVDEEFQLRAYRIWEIINYDTTNLMIEPDFHYNIISGNDVIDIAPTDDVDGIAGQSWLDITAKKAGTAILEVTYDAIHIVSGDRASDDAIAGLSDFTFNASDPARTALVVVQVGAAENDINFGFKLDRTDGWDVEFDTLYFTGEKGQIQLKPTVITDGTISKVEVSADKGETYTELTVGEDGYYTADIVSGNNIIRVTKADGSEHYQVVRGDKIDVVITEIAGASDQDGVIDAGEKIHIKFNGVHNVIGKMSGIYNPTNYKTNFTYNGEIVSGNGGQYTYPNAAQVEVTIPGNAAEGDTYTLTNGNTTNGGWGSASGAHRAVKGEVAPGLDADEVSNTGRNIFPDITLTVGSSIENEETDAVTSVTLDKTMAEVAEGESITLTAIVSPSDAADKTVTWSSSDDSIATVVNGTVTGVKVGTATITATAGGQFATCTITVTEAKEDDGSSSGGSSSDDSSSGGSTSGLDFGLSEDEIEGYVYVSFEDKGKRKADELADIEPEFQTPLGTIIGRTKVPFKAYDTIASVTLRLLDAKGFDAEYQGNEYGGFYLAAIGGFSANGMKYDSFGEFDAGQDSGWMITWEGVFINKGASEFYVENNDVVKWQYTCQLGADIGDDYLDEEGTVSGGGSGGAAITSDDRAAAKEVKELISVIGSVDKNSAEAIKAARAAYEALTDAQKELVTNLDELKAAEEAYAELTGEDIAPAEDTFADIKDHWAAKAIEYVADRGLMKGESETAFAPELATSRAMIATILYRLAGSPAVDGEASYTDIADGAWYADAIRWAEVNNVVSGYADGSFGPNDNITREQLASILYRYAAANGQSMNASADLSRFADADSVGEWARTALEWANAEGLITGKTGNVIDAKGKATRAEVATILMRYLDDIAA